MLRLNSMLYGEPDEVANALDTANDPTPTYTLAALINALRRIARLEKVAHPPVDGLAKAHDVERQLAVMSTRLDALERNLATIRIGVERLEGKS